MAMLNYFFHREIKGQLIEDQSHCYVDIYYYRACINSEKSVLTREGKLIGAVSLLGHIKNLPYTLLLGDIKVKTSREGIEMSQRFIHQDPFIAQEGAHILCQQRGWKNGNYFYRIFPDPEE